MRKPKSAEHRAAISAGKKGRPSRPPGFKHSEETKRKMVEFATGRHPNNEVRAKMSAAKVGRPPQWSVERLFYLNGIGMRSTWEVLLAKEFDARGIRWKYEPRRFHLGTCTYAPDFFLPEENCFWEVKGWFSEYSRKKVQLFREQYPEIPLIVANMEVMQQFGISKHQLLKGD